LREEWGAEKRACLKANEIRPRFEMTIAMTDFIIVTKKNKNKNKQDGCCCCLLPFLVFQLTDSISKCDFCWLHLVSDCSFMSFFGMSATFVSVLAAWFSAW